jgi:hypothetical protein
MIQQGTNATMSSFFRAKNAKKAPSSGSRAAIGADRKVCPYRDRPSF